MSGQNKRTKLGNNVAKINCTMFLAKIIEVTAMSIDTGRTCQFWYNWMILDYFKGPIAVFLSMVV